MNKTTAHKLGIALAGVLALIVLPARVNAAALAYIVTVLDSPGLARGINNSGQVVGTSQVSGDFRAVVWNGTTPTFLSSVGLHSEGNSINDAGQVAGVQGECGGELCQADLRHSDDGFSTGGPTYKLVDLRRGPGSQHRAEGRDAAQRRHRLETC